ncbi:MAG: DUF4365 domain-containing protein [Candidatus Delongbacteria bacterium]|nr:DUF4365 domain-containing protein [Candidatus Delongbacteria bacterium]
MEFPKRVEQHITETSSFKIFNSAIPNSWIVREISERDYGIDCYIELVDSNNQVTGELISIQLKGMQSITWTKENYYTLSGIKLSTTNYWRFFPIPVFICLVDLNSKEIFFNAAKESIRRDFLTYSNQDVFSYKIEKKCKLSISNIPNFIHSYYKEKLHNELQINIITFISHYHKYRNFIEENIGNDCFMGIEKSRLFYMKHLYNNTEFLCKYFQIPWDLKCFDEYIKISQSRYGNNYCLYEEQFEEISLKLNELLAPVILRIKNHITVEEKEYWAKNDFDLYNYLFLVKSNGEIDAW